MPSLPAPHDVVALLDDSSTPPLWRIRPRYGDPDDDVGPPQAFDETVRDVAEEAARRGVRGLVETIRPQRCWYLVPAAHVDRQAAPDAAPTTDTRPRPWLTSKRAVRKRARKLAKLAGQ